MPETIDYKVNVDVSSVGEQLQNVKNQIDQALAQYTFKNTVPDPIPFSASIPTAPAPMVAASPDAINTGFAQLQNDTFNFAQNARLGFQKFSEDVQNLALMTPIGKPITVRRSADRFLPDVSGYGPVKSFVESSAALDYDAHMSMTRGEYQRYAQAQFSDNGVQNITKFGLTTAGDFAGSAVGAAGLAAGATALGLAVPGPGWIAAAAIAGGYVGNKVMGKVADVGYDTFAATIGQDYDAARNMRTAARESSWRFLSGRMTDEQLGTITTNAAQLGRSEHMMGMRTSTKDIQEIMKSYTEAGGFDFARTASEFGDKLKMVVESIQKVEQVMRVSQDDAAKMITQWDRLGIVKSSKDVQAMGLLMQSQAFSAGYTAEEMAQYAQQSTEMVRGTGISMGSAYTGGITALNNMTTMIQNGAMPTDLVMQYGGKENMASTIQRLGYNWGLSQEGLIDIAANKFYSGDKNTGSMTPYERMSGAIGQLNNIDDLLTAKGAQANELSKLDGEELFAKKTATLIQNVKTMLGPDAMKNMNVDKMRAILMSQGLTGNEAELSMRYLANAGGPRGRALMEEQKLAVESIPDVIPRKWDEFSTGVARFFALPEVSNSATAADLWLGDKGRDIKNWWNESFNGYRIDLIAPVEGAASKSFWKGYNEVGKEAEVTSTPVPFRNKFGSSEAASNPSLSDTWNKETPADVITPITRNQRYMAKKYANSGFDPDIAIRNDDYDFKRSLEHLRYNEVIQDPRADKIRKEIDPKVNLKDEKLALEAKKLATFINEVGDGRVSTFIAETPGFLEATGLKKVDDKSPSVDLTLATLDKFTDDARKRIETKQGTKEDLNLVTQMKLHKTEMQARYSYANMDSREVSKALEPITDVSATSAEGLKRYRDRIEDTKAQLKEHLVNMLPESGGKEPVALVQQYVNAATTKEKEEIAEKIAQEKTDAGRKLSDFHPLTLDWYLSPFKITAPDVRPGLDIMAEKNSTFRTLSRELQIQNMALVGATNADAHKDLESDAGMPLPNTTKEIEAVLKTLPAAKLVKMSASTAHFDAAMSGAKAEEVTTLMLKSPAHKTESDKYERIKTIAEENKSWLSGLTSSDTQRTNEATVQEAQKRTADTLEEMWRAMNTRGIRVRTATGR